MIVTLTLNPGLDLTYALPESTLGEADVHRATTATMEASGKGVNVSRMLHLNGYDTVAVLPLGGPTGHHLAELLTIEGVAHRTVSQATPTRVNTTIALAGGQTAKVNGPGGALAPADLEALHLRLAEALRDAAGDEVWLAVCGSLPPGVDGSVVGGLVGLAHEYGARCAIDASGPALAAALSAGADLLAPNTIELAEVDPRAASASTVEDLAGVARDIAASTGTALLISLGADGALFTDGEAVVRGYGPALVPVNTAGAGDALLSGWLAAPATPVERMARAIRWGRAACLSPTTVVPDPVPEPVRTHTHSASNDTQGIVVESLSLPRTERSLP